MYRCASKVVVLTAVVLVVVGNAPTSHRTCLHHLTWHPSFDPCQILATPSSTVHCYVNTVHSQWRPNGVCEQALRLSS